MPDPFAQLKRKASHRSKAKLKLTYHIVVYSITGAPRSLSSAAFTIERGDHAFESTTATQARLRAAPCACFSGAAALRLRVQGLRTRLALRRSLAADAPRGPNASAALTCGARGLRTRRATGASSGTSASRSW